MKYKKKLAREFLILMSTGLIVLLLFFCLKLYNVYQKKEVTKIEAEISLLKRKHQIFLSTPLKIKNNNITQSKLDNFSNFIIANPNASNKYIFQNLVELNNDSSLLQALYDYVETTYSHKYKCKKEQNFKFPEFFVVNQSDIDSIKYFETKADILENEIIDARIMILSQNEIEKYIYWFSVILISVAYGLRYLFYATRWSIKTIKRKE